MRTAGRLSPGLTSLAFPRSRISPLPPARLSWEYRHVPKFPGKPRMRDRKDDAALCLGQHSRGIKPGSSPSERSGEEVGDLKSHRLSLSLSLSPRPSLPAAGFGIPGISAGIAGAAGSIRMVPVRSSVPRGGRGRVGLGFPWSSRWFWRCPGDVRRGRAGVGSRDPGFPWDCLGILLIQAAHPGLERGSASLCPFIPHPPIHP